MAMVRQILDTITDLSSTYAQSTLPKGIKKFLYKSQIKKINKIIEKIPEDGKISFLDLVEFITDIFTRYHNTHSTQNTVVYDNMKVELKNDSLYNINNIQEYNILILVSQDSYVKISLQYNIDYRNPNTYECIITVKNIDNKTNSPNTRIILGFTKYQEISMDIINKIAVEDKLSDSAKESYELVLVTIIASIKKYLKSYVGAYGSINL